MKFTMLGLIISGFIIAGAQEPKPLIKNPSLYRTIDTTSERSRLEGITGAGVGNIIFSTRDLPLNQEKTYTDLRDTFYVETDTSLFCCAYFPGTLGSLAGIIKSQYPGAKFLELWAELVTTAPEGESLSYSRQWQGPLADKENWDKLYFRLLPYFGSQKNDFVPLDLSKYPRAAGTSVITIKLFLKFDIGAVLDFPTPSVKNFLVAWGTFFWVRR